MTARIVQGNALALPLPDASVDLIVTSPPYFGLRSYQDGGEHYAGQIGAEAKPAEFVAALVAATAEMVRVLKPSGSIFVNLGDKYAERTGPCRDGGRDDDTMVKRPAFRPQRGRRGATPVKSLMLIPERYRIACVDQLGLIARAVIVWDKPNGMPESVTDRVRRSHEDWVHFTKAPRYFSSVDEVRQPIKPGQHAAALSFNREGRETAPGQTMAPHRVGRPDQGANPAGKLPGSVWRIPTQPLTVPDHLGIDHFAAFPMEWPRRIIKGWSPVGGVVLDPFGGTGTTALVASVLGRTGISVDMSHDYCRLATWRTTDRGQIAAAMQVDKPEPVDAAQGGLFELDGAA